MISWTSAGSFFHTLPLTSNCPPDWNPTEGAADSIKLGYSNTQSGTLAAYGDIGVGMDVYVDWINANGGVDGKQVELLTKDEAGTLRTDPFELEDDQA